MKIAWIAWAHFPDYEDEPPVLLTEEPREYRFRRVVRIAFDELDDARFAPDDGAEDLV